MVHLAHRIDKSELMDSAELSADELRPALEFIAKTNRWLGGNQILFNYLKRWSRGWPKGREVAILDAGTGGADIPIAIAKWGRRHGFKLRIRAVDSTPAIAVIARQNTRDYPEIEIAEADFFSLASSAEIYDYVLGSLFLHHLPDERLIEALRLCDRLARRGIIISDLLRSPLAYCGVKALTSLFGNRVVRNDGPLSVRRAFRPQELETLAVEAGVPYLRVQRHSFFRLSLAGEKGAVDA